MPNSKNYKQNLPTTFVDQYTLKRVLVDEQYVIKREVEVIGIGGEDPVQNFYNFGLDLDREFVEMHFYTPDSNNLVFSTAIPLIEEVENGYFYLHDITSEDDKLTFYIKYWVPGPGPDLEDDNPNYWFNENSLQEKYLYGLPAGTYDVVFNFFADEVGTYNDTDDNFYGQWRIKQISSSGRELVLHARPSSGDGTVAENFEDLIWRDYQQFLYASLHSKDFRNFWLNFGNNTEQTAITLESFLNQPQKLYAENFLTLQGGGYEGDLPVLQKYINHLLLHLYYEIRQYFNDEVDGLSTYLEHPEGGNRYRIQWNRFQQVLSSAIARLSQEHTQTININDSGEIPFIVNV